MIVFNQITALINLAAMVSFQTIETVSNNKVCLDLIYRIAKKNRISIRVYKDIINDLNRAVVLLKREHHLLHQMGVVVVVLVVPLTREHHRHLLNQVVVVTVLRANHNPNSIQVAEVVLLPSTKTLIQIPHSSASSSTH